VLEEGTVRRSGLRGKRVGFYERRTRRVGPAGGAEEEIRRRLRELVFRTPEEKRLLMAALRVMLGGKDGGPKDTAERMTAVLESLGEQFLPAE
jgi:hypothetical protein